MGRAAPGSPVRRTAWWRVSAAVTAAALLAVCAPPVAAAPAAPEAPGEPPEGGSLITVHTGGDRTGTRTVAPLDGVVLGLYETEDAASPVAESWATCTSSGGVCEFAVPDTGGADAGVGYWVGQVSAPDGWYMNPVLRTGRGSGSASVANPYRFRTPVLEADRAYSSLSDFMYADVTSGSDAKASEGIWQDSRENPPLPRRCGLDVALILDLSSSVGGDLPDLKDAADTFADSLVGTPSRMAVFSFDGASPPARGGGENLPDLVPVSTQEGADAFKAQYADWELGSGTNWDRGIYSVAEAAPAYDVALMITDGNPTRFSDPRLGDGSNTHFRDVENGIYSANAVKAQGTRLVAFGVGSGLDETSALNLRALSGPSSGADVADVLDTDYFQITDYARAGEILSSLMTDLCAGSLTVVKRVVPAGNGGEDVSGSVASGPGWEFSAESSDTGVGGLPATATTTDDGTGSVNFELSYPTGTGTAPVTVTETQQEGYEIVTQGGENAVCLDLADGSAIGTDAAGGTGFTLDVPAGAAVSCTVYNRPVQASVRVDKQWRVDGVLYEHADRPEGLDAGLTLTGPEGAGATPQGWGEAREGYTAGEGVTIAETVDVDDPECRLVSALLTAAGGEAVLEPLPFDATLAAGENTYRVTNTVVCDRPAPSTLLTLVKEVDNRFGGTASPQDWTLSAQGPAPVSGVSGADEVTGAEVDPGEYALAESGGPQGYAALPWECRNENGAVAVEDASVTLAEGTSTTCTVVNVEQEQPSPSPSPSPSPEPSPEPSGEPSGEPSPTPPPNEGGPGPKLPLTGAPLLGLVIAALTAVAGGGVLALLGRVRRGTR